MKWLFSLMVLLNAGFFVWRAYLYEPPPPVHESGDDLLAGHVNRLLLLNEFEEGKLRLRDNARAEPTVDRDTPPARALGASPAITGLCFSVGPLASPEEVETIGVWLRSRGGVVTLRQGERREIAMFWVYLSPFETREQAVQQVTTMRENDIDDIYVIPGGDMANAVSLGLYSQRTSLERRLKELRGKGYEPSIVPRYTTKKASWFDVKFPDSFEFPSERFGESFPAAEAKAVICA